MISVGVIGLGKIAQSKYLPYLFQHPEVRIRAVCDRSHDLAHEIGKRYQVPSERCLSEVQSMTNLGLDVIFVLNHDHYEVARLACEVCPWVFVEKPLVWSTTEARSLAAHSQRFSSKIVVGYMRRHDPAVLGLHQLLTRSGPPVQVRARNWAGGPTDDGATLLKPPPDVRHSIKGEMETRWTRILDEQAGPDPVLRAAFGTIVQLGIHEINLVRFLFGRIMRVRSAVAWPLRDRPNSAGVCCELELQEGTSCQVSIVPMIKASWPWCEDVEVVLDKSIERLELGNPFLSANQGRLIGAHHRETLVGQDPGGDVFHMQIDALLQAMKDGGAPPVDLDEGMADLEVVEEVMRVLRTKGKP